MARREREGGGVNRVFVIADTHFSHRKVTEFRPWATVEEHDRALVEAWNATVRKDDTVWHLGDVCLGGRDKLAILSTLNGIKRLVLGNHDTYPKELYGLYFNKIFGAAEWHDCILTHVPVHPYQLDTRYRLNVHGHMHDKRIDGDARYRCVSAEQIDYMPKLMWEVIAP
jgi:calcineurin-like phosphoesterase family protein